jgi:CheY-like chemotaxis protein
MNRMKHALLLVEDNLMNLQMLRDWLESEDLEVEVAVNLTAARAALLRRAPPSASALASPSSASALASQALSSASALASQALSSASALASQALELVLLDVRLGEEDGLDLARWIRATPELKHLPVIAVTAHALRHEQDEIMRQGCNAVVSKPIDFRLLRRQLDLWLSVTR